MRLPAESGFSRFRARFRRWIAAVLIISFSLTFIQNIPAEPPVKNSLFAIVPYKFDGVWVFDDPDVGLVKEPFISGADRILDVLTQTMPDAYKGFRLLFSSRPFPGYTAKFIWSRSEYGGNWYFWPEKEMEGWLCPALFKYFKQVPLNLYVKVTSVPVQSNWRGRPVSSIPRASTGIAVLPSEDGAGQQRVPEGSDNGAAMPWRNDFDEESAKKIGIEVVDQVDQRISVNALWLYAEKKDKDSLVRVKAANNRTGFSLERRKRPRAFDTRGSNRCARLWACAL
jgi:hypothetical protein